MSPVTGHFRKVCQHDYRPARRHPLLPDIRAVGLRGGIRFVIGKRARNEAQDA